MKSIAIILMLMSVAAAHDTHSVARDKMFQKIGTFESSVNGESTTKIYYVSRDIKLYWAHALMFCQSYGMKLVELPTAEEARVFTKHCADNSHYFDQWTHIGGSYIGNGLNKWYWVSTGQSVDYHLTMPSGEPNNYSGKQNCLGIDKRPGYFMFNDIDGYGVHEERFVCQYEVKPIINTINY